MDELRKELEHLKEKQFMLNMCDHWSKDDYEYSDKLHKRILEIESELKKAK